MKILKWVGWSSLAVGAGLIVLGVVSQLFRIRPFRIEHNISYIHIASSFFLLAIAIFVVKKDCCQCDCKNNEEIK